MEILTFGLSLSVNRKQLCPNVKGNKAVIASLLNFHSKPTARSGLRPIMYAMWCSKVIRKTESFESKEGVLC